MAADSAGNDITAVPVPVTGYIGIGPYGTPGPSPSEGASESLTLDPAIRKIGLATEDGGPEWTTEPDGDPIVFWQDGYSIPSGQANCQIVVKAAEYNDWVRQLIAGKVPDANGYVTVDAGGHATRYVAFTEEIFKNSDIRRRWAPNVTLAGVKLDKSERGNVNGCELTFNVGTHATVNNEHFGEWYIRAGGSVTPPAAWKASTSYSVGDQVSLTGGEVLECTTAGTSDTTEPTAPSVGQNVTDGTVTWQRLS